MLRHSFVADPSAIIGRAVVDYTGVALTSLEISPDPNVAGVYAIQAVLDDGRTLQFLLKGVPVHKTTADDLEECEFSSWPPEVNRG